METLRLLGILARQCSLVMENALLYEHLRREHESLQKAQSQIIQTEKLASIGRLTRAASHEILNPLNIISGYAHLLKLGAGDDSKPSRYLNEIINESGRIAKVVSGLMAFKGSDALKTSSADINSVVEKAISLTEYAAKFNKVAISFLAVPGISPVVGDSEDLMQVIISIINNSLEAMPEGGDLEIELEPHLVERGGQEGEGFVKIKITDTGCGVPGDIREKVLEPFFTTKGDKAMGLGLYMAYCVIQRCGGTVQLESGYGEKGTCVTIILPLAPGQ
jgi:signal transduction histidine kinase